MHRRFLGRTLSLIQPVILYNCRPGFVPYSHYSDNGSKLASSCKLAPSVLGLDNRGSSLGRADKLHLYQLYYHARIDEVRPDLLAALQYPMGQSYEHRNEAICEMPKTAVLQVAT